MTIDLEAIPDEAIQAAAQTYDATEVFGVYDLDALKAALAAAAPLLRAPLVAEIERLQRLREKSAKRNDRLEHARRDAQAEVVRLRAIVEDVHQDLRDSADSDRQREIQLDQMHLRATTAEADAKKLRAIVEAVRALCSEWIMEANDDVPMGVLAIRAALGGQE